jgi:hypothetical protein
LSSSCWMFGEDNKLFLYIRMPAQPQPVSALGDYLLARDDVRSSKFA